MHFTTENEELLLMIVEKFEGDELLRFNKLLIDEVEKHKTKQLILSDVSQQRELLLAWEEQKYFDFDWVKNKEMVTAKIDKYLANNCG